MTNLTDRQAELAALNEAVETLRYHHPLTPGERRLILGRLDEVRPFVARYNQLHDEHRKLRERFDSACVLLASLHAQLEDAGLSRLGESDTDHTLPRLIAEHKRLREAVAWNEDQRSIQAKEIERLNEVISQNTRLNHQLTCAAARDHRLCAHGYADPRDCPDCRTGE